MWKVEKYSKQEGWEVQKDNLSYEEANEFEKTIRKPGVLTAIKLMK